MLATIATSASSAPALDWWQAVVLGLVEGITEYLPVSSTGHLIIASGLMGLDEPEPVRHAVNVFNIVIQGGAILAVLGLYFGRVLQMLRGLAGKDAGGLRLVVNLMIAFIPAAVLGVLFDDKIEAVLFNTPAVLAALAIGGVYMIVLDFWKIRPMREAEKKRGNGQSVMGNGQDRKAQAFQSMGSSGTTIDELSWGRALVVGLLQCVAMIPGTSRSMMTITGGVLVGLRPKEAAEFSFLLGLPTLGGACVYKLAKDLSGDGPSMFEVIGIVPIIIGLVVATISAALAVHWLVGFLNKHGLAAFGWYRLGLCAALGGLILSGFVSITL